MNSCQSKTCAEGLWARKDVCASCLSQQAHTAAAADGEAAGRAGFHQDSSCTAAPYNCIWCHFRLSTGVQEQTHSPSVSA